MLPAIQLLRNLKEYDKAYVIARGNLRVELMISKLAILDVCGWVEEAMDHLVYESACRSCLTPTRITTVKKYYIKNTYGFHYTNHFEKMLNSIVGYKNLEQLENSIASDIAIFESILNQLNKLRNHYAHTHLNLNAPYPDGLSQIPMPSLMKGHAMTVISVLKNIEKRLKSAGY